MDIHHSVSEASNSVPWVFDSEGSNEIQYRVELSGDFPSYIYAIQSAALC